MVKEVFAIAVGLAALAAVAYAGVRAVGVGSDAPLQRAAHIRSDADLVCTDYCPIGARSAIAGGL